MDMHWYVLTVVTHKDRYYITPEDVKNKNIQGRKQNKETERAHKVLWI